MKKFEQNDNIGGRFTKIKADFFGNSNRVFAQNVGIDETTMSSICNGKKIPSDAIKEKIISACPTISRAWLYFGEGQMIEGEVVIPTQQSGNPTISNNTAPVAANGSSITSPGLADSERQLYERIIKGLEERVENQAAYIRLLSDEHRGLVHQTMDIVTDNNNRLQDVQAKATKLDEQVAEMHKIGFRLMKDNDEITK